MKSRSLLYCLVSVSLFTSCKKGWMYENPVQPEQPVTIMQPDTLKPVPTEPIKSSVNVNYRTLNDNAIKLFTKGQALDAYFVMNESIRSDSTVADSYYIRGLIGQKAFNLQFGLNDFLKVLELNPNHIDALLKCGIIYGKQGDKNTSCRYFNRACELGSSDACEGVARFCNQQLYK